MWPRFAFKQICNSWLCNYPILRPVFPRNNNFNSSSVAAILYTKYRMYLHHSYSIKCFISQSSHISTTQDKMHKITSIRNVYTTKKSTPCQGIWDMDHYETILLPTRRTPSHDKVGMSMTLGHSASKPNLVQHSVPRLERPS